VTIETAALQHREYNWRYTLWNLVSATACSSTTYLLLPIKGWISSRRQLCVVVTTKAVAAFALNEIEAAYSLAPITRDPESGKYHTNFHLVSAVNFLFVFLIPTFVPNLLGEQNINLRQALKLSCHHAIYSTLPLSGLYFVHSLVCWSGLIDIAQFEAPESNEPTLYDVLGVDRNASDEEIRKAYRKRSKVEHSDRGGDGFQQLGHAYETLGEPLKRMTYDQEQLEAAASYHRSLSNSIWMQDLYSGQIGLASLRLAASLRLDRKRQDREFGLLQEMHELRIAEAEKVAQRAEELRERYRSSEAEYLDVQGKMIELVDLQLKRPIWQEAIEEELLGPRKIHTRGEEGGELAQLEACYLIVRLALEKATRPLESAVDPLLWKKSQANIRDCLLVLERDNHQCVQIWTDLAETMQRFLDEAESTCRQRNLSEQRSVDSQPEVHVSTPTSILGERMGLD